MRANSIPTEQLAVFLELSPVSLLPPNYNPYPTVILSPNELERIISIQTVDNDIYDESQVLKIAIRSYSHYNVSATDDTISLAFINDDVPTLSFQGNADVIEAASNGELRVLTDFQPAGPLYVNYSPENIVGDFLQFEDTYIDKIRFQESDLPNETSYGILKVPIVNNQTHEPTGTISVTLEADTSEYPTYNVVETEAKTAILTVYDDDLPEFSITGATSAIEGGLAEFTLSWQVYPYENLTVPIRFEPAELISGNNVHMVDVSTTNRNFEQTIQVQLADNSSFERHVRVLTGSIEPSTDYTISTDQSSARVNVYDEAQPLISITSTTSTVTEGDTVTFRIQSDKALLTDLFVAVEFSPSSLVVGDATRVEELALSNTDRFVEFQVQVADDDVKYNGYNLTATIRDGDNYAPSASPNSQFDIHINDNDDYPTFSIAPVASQIDGIVEGRTAEFEVTASHIIDEELKPLF